MLHRTRIGLPATVREKAIALLQARLFDALDLEAQLKHAHWNVKGPNFIALHELFEKLHDSLEDEVDDMAERITALGGMASGTVQETAKHTTLPAYPVGADTGKWHVEAMATAFADFGTKVRAAIDEAAAFGDADTADLFTGVSRLADKSLWLLEAHLQANE